ncbi:hypothetical protein HMF3257_14925 [Spirosoma telluris]|uniref:Integrase catalytic domain-containing protein n=1 Tax=Spirosoma telluris TaxID=2183553 RepID=A0A327NK54_9BACT|nr:hypothetical protein HMF3257_14925 [Spirosoma telluris]
MSFQTDAILQEVRRIRREVPGMGTHKLHHELSFFLTRHRIKLGRDRLHALLKENGMLAKKKASKVATTESNHPHYKYPNKAKDIKPIRINELWVSDLTYIPVGINFAHLHLYVIMDAFSRKIVGWSLHKTMHAKGAIEALNMALLARKDISQPLIGAYSIALRPM